LENESAFKYNAIRGELIDETQLFVILSKSAIQDLQQLVTNSKQTLELFIQTRYKITQNLYRTSANLLEDLE